MQMNRIVFTFGTLYPDNMIEALLGRIPDNFYTKLHGHSIYKAGFQELPEKVKEFFVERNVNKETFSCLFAKSDPQNTSIIEGRTYTISLTDELILNHWEQYPNWYRKTIQNDQDESFEALIYTLDIDGEQLTEFKRVMNNPEKALQNAKIVRERVLSKFLKLLKSNCATTRSTHPQAVVD